jgi:hypothetical protein
MCANRVIRTYMPTQACVPLCVFQLSHGKGTLPFPLLPTPPPASLPEEPRRVDAREIFQKPGRSTRPDPFVVILRGLPGRGRGRASDCPGHMVMAVQVQGFLGRQFLHFSDLRKLAYICGCRVSQTTGTNSPCSFQQCAVLKSSRCSEPSAC